MISSKAFFKKISSKVYLIKHPLYAVTYFIFRFFVKKGTPIYFYSDDELVKMLHEGKTIIRLGDGDMVNIVLGMENVYHRDDIRLRDMYTEIISGYSTKSPYVLSVPRFICLSSKELYAMGGAKKVAWGARMKAMFYLQYSKNCGYMDAHNFYYDNYFASIVAPVFLHKKVICITNKKIIEEQSKNKALPWQDIMFIESPEIDAIDAYDTIVKSLDTLLLPYDKHEVIIFAAMGPIGKGILCKYAKLGYQGVDIGRGLEVAYKNESLEDLFPEIKINKTTVYDANIA